MGYGEKEEMIKLGYEIKTGKEVGINPSHLIVTGLTQLSGKTTTLGASRWSRRVPMALAPVGPPKPRHPTGARLDSLLLGAASP